MPLFDSENFNQLCKSCQTPIDSMNNGTDTMPMKCTQMF